MKKEININFADIKNSPYLIVAVLGVFVALILALCVYLTMDILDMKQSVAEVKAEYAANASEVEYLQGLKAKREQLKNENESYLKMLPRTKNQYEITKLMYDACDLYNLEVVAMDAPVVLQTYTTETAVNMSVRGTYENIVNMLDSFSNNPELHRVEKFILSNDSDSGMKLADVSITVLSSDGLPQTTQAPAAESSSEETKS